MGRRSRLMCTDPSHRPGSFTGVFAATSLPGDKMEVNTFHRVGNTYDCNVFNTVYVAVLLNWLPLTSVLAFCHPSCIKKMI